MYYDWNETMMMTMMMVLNFFFNSLTSDINLEWETFSLIIMIISFPNYWKRKFFSDFKFEKFILINSMNWNLFLIGKKQSFLSFKLNVFMFSVNVFQLAMVLMFPTTTLRLINCWYEKWYLYQIKMLIQRVSY